MGSKMKKDEDHWSTMQELVLKFCRTITTKLTMYSEIAGIKRHT